MWKWKKRIMGCHGKCSPFGAAFHFQCNLHTIHTVLSVSQIFYLSDCQIPAYQGLVVVVWRGDNRDLDRRRHIICFFFCPPLSLPLSRLRNLGPQFQTVASERKKDNYIWWWWYLGFVRLSPLLSIERPNVFIFVRWQAKELPRHWRKTVAIFQQQRERRSGPGLREIYLLHLFV